MILFIGKNIEFAPPPTSDIISYRMRRSEKLIIQDTDNGCCGVTVQEIKIREKNNLSCVHLQPPVKRQAAYKFQTRSKEKSTGDRRSLQNEIQ